MSRTTYVPHAYQTLMTEHTLAHRRGNRYAGMGMGKTVASLTAIDAMNVEEGTELTLVLGPLRVIESTWPRECAKWHHLTEIEFQPITGPREQRLRALKADANVFGVNYENVPWLIREYADRRWPFRRVIADESRRLSNFRIKQGGKRSASLASVAHQEVGMWSNLTGTPAPKGLVDLWGPQWFVDRGASLGRTYTAFVQRWFSKAWDGYGVDPKESAQAQIQDAIRSTTIALDPKDWFDLEEPIVRNIKVDLPPEARRRYREMEKQMFTELTTPSGNRGVEALNAAAKSMKCLQIASGSVWVDTAAKLVSEVHEAKLDALDSLLSEAGGMPLLVVYQWVPSKDALLRRFPKFKFYDGKQSTEDNWNAGRYPGMVIHPQSGGHGLNLQYGSNITVHYDQWWDLETYQQVNERLGPVRQLQSGLNRNSWVYHLLASDTVDEDVLVRRETKREVQDILLDAMKRRQQ
jgi:SNF2 family DNA or RNA helicase